MKTLDKCFQVVYINNIETRWATAPTKREWQNPPSRQTGLQGPLEIKSERQDSRVNRGQDTHSNRTTSRGCGYQKGDAETEG